MRAPRRIFRSQFATHPRRVRPALLAAAALTSGVALTALAGLPFPLFGRAASLPDRVSAAPGDTAVIDGATMRLAGQVVRLRGVDAPERGELCRGGLDCGGAATTALARLVRERPVACRLAGQDRQGRPFAACDAGDTNLNRAIVASGWARAGTEVPELAGLELRARQQGIGLWAGGAE